MVQQYQTEHEIREGCKKIVTFAITHFTRPPIIMATQFAQIHLLFYFLSEAENLSLLAPSGRLRLRRHRSKRKRRLLHLSAIRAVISLNIKLIADRKEYILV